MFKNKSPHDFMLNQSLDCFDLKSASMPSENKKKFIIHYLPVFGCISTGIIYGAIGIIAILSFLRLKDGGADESSLLAFLNEFLAGKILVIVILFGTICYIVWRIYESYTDPYDYGNDKKGLAKRAGIALSSIADALIVYAAIRYLFGMGNIQENQQLSEQRQTVETILQESWGTSLVITIGAVVVLTAVVQLFYGVTRGYRERMEIEELSFFKRKTIHFLGITGYFSRGIILGIIGFFYIKAGITEDAGTIVNTDKAFDFIGDNIGHFYFITVATGTIFYGLFMIALGVAYDSDKD